MPLPDCRLGAALLPLLLVPSIACRAEEPEIWNSHITRVWLDDHVSVTRHTARTRPAYGLARTQVWSSGIARSDAQAFAASDSDRTVGAKLQPFHNLNFTIGTELTRSAGETRFLSSKTIWEAFWSRDRRRLGGFEIGFSTTGSLSHLQAGYSQSVSGVLRVPLGLSVDAWSTEFRVSPSMSLDASSRAVSTGLLSEVMGQRVLSSRADPFKSVLNVKLGYGVAPHARPTASAKLELRISPNL